MVLTLFSCRRSVKHGFRRAGAAFGRRAASGFRRAASGRRSFRPARGFRRAASSARIPLRGFRRAASGRRGFRPARNFRRAASGARLPARNFRRATSGAQPPARVSCVASISAQVGLPARVAGRQPSECSRRVYPLRACECRPRRRGQGGRGGR
jgi:hypothetical protein